MPNLIKIHNDAVRMRVQLTFQSNTQHTKLHKASAEDSSDTDPTEAPMHSTSHHHITRSGVRKVRISAGVLIVSLAECAVRKRSDPHLSAVRRRYIADAPCNPAVGRWPHLLLTQGSVLMNDAPPPPRCAGMPPAKERPVPRPAGARAAATQPDSCYPSAWNVSELPR